jgi:hypothetical protein
MKVVVSVDVGAGVDDPLIRMEADATDRAVVTQAILRFRRVVAGEEDREVVIAGQRGTGSIDAAGEETAGDTAHCGMRRYRDVCSSREGERRGCDRYHGTSANAPTAVRM